MSDLGKMDFEDLKRVFESVYGEIKGSLISNMGRAPMNYDDKKYLIYGEISFDELFSLFECPVIKREMRKSRVFCDLGSGTGRILVEMGLLYPHLSDLIGIEIVKTLSDTSKKVRKKLSEIDKKVANRIKIINDNFFNVNFSPKFMDVDVIFMHYPMHDAEDLYMKLEEKMRAELKPGALVVSAIRRLEDVDTFLEIDAPHKVQCHYGTATTYFHKKI
jgi:SAM-dependent methyltransferase